MPFGYLRDRMFVAGCFVYTANRWVFRAWWPEGFHHRHLNALLCLPVFVPVMLWSMRLAGLRRYDGPPRFHEVVLPLIGWSVLFEIVMPGLDVFNGLTWADPADVFYYALGGLAGAAYWRWRYASDEPGECKND